MTLDIHSLMQELSQSRPIFHSEADFQHALAWQIGKRLGDHSVRLEYPFKTDGSGNRELDIWLPTEKIAIELKYFTKYLRTCHNSEPFELKEQAASDLARRLFLNDVLRLEWIIDKGQDQANAGYAIFLTNDPLLWECSSRGSTSNYRCFRIHEGSLLRDRLRWFNGEIENSKYSITLCGSYKMHWQDYSNFAGEKYGKFRYIAVAIH